MFKKLQTLAKIPIQDEFYRKLPQTPGIYIFWKKNTPIYIGKAVNLKNRISSYFSLKLEPKTSKMISEADFLSYIKVASELEALLLEARLIRKNMPQYNIAAKDDKHPLYIAITREKYPRIVSVRKLIANGYELIASYGPFPSSQNVKSVLKMLRRIFPFSDHKVGKRGCLYSQIGLCSPCPSLIEMTNDESRKINLRKRYLDNLRRLKSVLDGNIAKVCKDLQEEMRRASSNQDYEQAAKLRDQIEKIDYITRPSIRIEKYLENPNLYEDLKAKELRELGNILKKYGGWRDYPAFQVEELNRIECYDIAHLAGSYPTASMVAFVNGEGEKSLYRHFRIRQKKGNSDIDSLREVISRRQRHFRDWGKPNLIIVDGGRPQVEIFIRNLASENIPVIGLAKRFETLVIPIKAGKTLTMKEYKLPKGGALNLVTRIRDEAHRFARKLHHNLVSRALTA